MVEKQSKAHLKDYKHHQNVGTELLLQRAIINMSHMAALLLERGQNSV